MNQSDSDYLATGIELAARLRDISFNVADDLAQEGNVFYCIDPQILDVLVDPIGSLIDVNLFGRSGADLEKSKNFFSKESKSIHFAIAQLVFASLVGDDSENTFREKLLLFPNYDEEAKAAIFHYRRESFKASKLRLQTEDISKRLQNDLNEIRQTIQEHKEKRLDIWLASTAILETMSGVLSYALAPEDETPLSKFRKLVEKGLFKSQREILKNIKSEQQIREMSLYDSLADEIYEAKKHILYLRDDRTEQALRLAVKNDAQAIVSVMLLNQFFASQQKRDRAVFVTADPTLLRLLSSDRNRLQLLQGESRDFMIRSPIEIPAVFTAAQPPRINTGLLKQIGYFDYFLDDGNERTKDQSYRSYLNSIRNNEARVHLPNLQMLPTNLVRGVEYDLRNVTRAFQVSLVRKNIRTLETVEKNLTRFSQDVSRILDESGRASDIISDGISQVLGVSLSYGSAGHVTTQRDLAWVLNAALSTSVGEAPKARRPQFLKFRFPCFLLFSDRQLNYFRDLLNEHVDARKIFEKVNNPGHRGELTLANAFLFGVAGDWRKAERLAQVAIQFSLDEGGNAKGRYPLREEAIYFRAVACRHSLIPSVERWKEAATALRQLVALDPLSIDLRYYTEDAVLGLSVPNHVDIYGIQYEIIPHGDPNQTLVAFQRAALRFETEYRNSDTELAVRLGTQIYTNLCVLFVQSRMISPRLSIQISPSEIRAYLESLIRLTEQTKTWHSTSYFVSLIKKAVELELSTLDAAARLAEYESFVSDLEAENEAEIIAYDLSKIKALRSYFEAGTKSSPRAPIN